MSVIPRTDSHDSIERIDDATEETPLIQNQTNEEGAKTFLQKHRVLKYTAIFFLTLGGAALGAVTAGIMVPHLIALAMHCGLPNYSFLASHTAQLVTMGVGGAVGASVMAFGSKKTRMCALAFFGSGFLLAGPAMIKGLATVVNTTRADHAYKYVRKIF